MLQLKKKIKKWLVDIVKKNVLLRDMIRKVFYIKRLLFYNIRKIGVKVDDKKIVFGCFKGRSYCDSPKAIYEYMISHPEYKDYKFIWIFKYPDQYKKLEKNKNTKVIYSHGRTFEKTLASAKYWIFNYKIAEHLYPNKNQVFVQCWHGTPLKRLGCDLQFFGNALNTLEGMKKRYNIEASKFSYFISPSKFASEKFTSIWNLKENGKENIIIEQGYPRNDFLYNYNQEDVIKVKKKLGIEKNSKKILLYAPTYRDNQHTSGVGYTYETKVNFDLLKEKLGKDYIILFRGHWLVANNFDFEKYNGFIFNVSDYDDINELYIIADVLITDYSSVFFDYANLKRPIVFYMYDLEEYRDKLRGFYIDLKELPGNIVKNEEDLINEINYLTHKFNYSSKYKEFNEKFNYLDDGHATERVLNKILGK